MLSISKVLASVGATFFLGMAASDQAFSNGTVLNYRIGSSNQRLELDVPYVGLTSRERAFAGPGLDKEALLRDRVNGLCKMYAFWGMRFTPSQSLTVRGVFPPDFSGDVYLASPDAGKIYFSGSNDPVLYPLGFETPQMQSESQRLSRSSRAWRYFYQAPPSSWWNASKAFVCGLGVAAAAVCVYAFCKFRQASSDVGPSLSDFWVGPRDAFKDLVWHNLGAPSAVDMWRNVVVASATTAGASALYYGGANAAETAEDWWSNGEELNYSEGTEGESTQKPGVRRVEAPQGRVFEHLLFREVLCVADPG